MPTMNDVLGVIMGGGRGSRLYPLTKLRAKPAVPVVVLSGVMNNVGNEIFARPFYCWEKKQ